MLRIFKKKENKIDNNKINMHLIKVKRNVNSCTFHIGKFISIDIDETTNNFYFIAYNNEANRYVRITNKIDNTYYDLCNKYEYGLIYGIDNEYYTIAVICCNGFLKAYNVTLNKPFENGNAFIINNNNLIEGNSIVGKIDKNDDLKISLNSLDNNKLICFIRK